MKPKAILTFDLEFWYNDLILEKYLPKERDSSSDYTKDLIGPILDLLKRYEVKATFFILGRLAAEKTSSGKNDSREGTRNCSRGYWHKLVYQLSPREFRKDLQKSIKILDQ